MSVFEKVNELLLENPRLRENDNMLIAYYIKEVYGLQNTFDIALSDKINGNIYETIRRARQKIQETNPVLRASEPVQTYRNKKQQDVKERMRGV